MAFLMKSRKNKIISYIFLFVTLSILSAPSILSICKLYPNLAFDNQALLYWKYAASVGAIPYKEIFYPYGLLTYYAGQINVFSILYFILFPSTFFCIYYLFQKIFKNKFYVVSSFVFFYIFIFYLTGFETFGRYGVLTGLCLLIVLIIREKEITKRRKNIFFYSLLIGILFPFINDVGFYVPILFSLISIVSIILENTTNLAERIKRIIYDLIYFYLGYLVGIIPFILYLAYTHSFGDFVNYILQLREIASFAKTPFFHSISTVNNIFVILMLISGIIVIVTTVVNRKEQFTINRYLQLVLVLLLLLLEQKNIIRSIDTQITFVGFLLFISLFYDFTELLSKYKINKQKQYLYFINLCIIIIFIIGLKPPELNINFYDLPKHVSLVSQTFQNKNCVQDNLAYNANANKPRTKVIESLKKTKNFNGKVYSFPGDPIFYVLLNQIPPYYPSIYEATPISSQQKLIKYIEDEDIEYVIYNSSIKSLQDEVPDKVRARLLYNYIFKHFEKHIQIEQYIILKKK